MVVFFEVSGEPVLCLPSYKYVDRNQGISIAGFVVVSHRVALEVGMLSDVVIFLSFVISKMPDARPHLMILSSPPGPGH